MKRKELLKEISLHGCILIRHGSNHDLFINPVTGKKQPIPRHKEIDEHLARHLIRELS